MKKILGYVLTIALLIGLFPTAIFAKQPTYCYDSANVVGSCRLTAQAQTDGKLSDTTGGTVIRKNVDAKYFECGGGVWTFGAVTNSGYRFVGWEHSVSWEELHHCKWISKREVNPEKIDGIIFPHIDNRNGNGAFHSDEDHMAIHHVGCNVQEGIRNVHYNIIAKFERITVTFTINHYRETRNLSGDLLSTEPVVTETKDGKFENDKVKPSQYKKTYKGYKFDNTRNDIITLVSGANELNVYYIKTIDDTPVSSDTSSTTSSDTSSTTSSDTSSTTSSDTSSTTSSNVTPPPYIPPTETIEEEETPLTPAPVETIEEEEVPLAPAPTKAPQTGDATPIGILLWLAVASSTVLVAGKIKRLKENN